MYVWMDALTNYLSVLGYPDRDGPLCRFLAMQPAYYRQGYHAFSYGLLARFFDGGGFAVAKTGFRAWVFDRKGRENVEIARQCPRPDDTGRALWR